FLFLAAVALDLDAPVREHLRDLRRLILGRAEGDEAGPRAEPPAAELLARHLDHGVVGDALDRDLLARHLRHDAELPERLVLAQRGPDALALELVVGHDPGGRGLL